MPLQVAEGEKLWHHDYLLIKRLVELYGASECNVNIAAAIMTSIT
jgi:hypothetical protein